MREKQISGLRRETWYDGCCWYLVSHLAIKSINQHKQLPHTSLWHLWTPTSRRWNSEQVESVLVCRSKNEQVSSGTEICQEFVPPWGFRNARHIWYKIQDCFEKILYGWQPYGNVIVSWQSFWRVMTSQKSQKSWRKPTRTTTINMNWCTDHWPPLYGLTSEMILKVRRTIYVCL